MIYLPTVLFCDTMQQFPIKDEYENPHILRGEDFKKKKERKKVLEKKGERVVGFTIKIPEMPVKRFLLCDVTLEAGSWRGWMDDGSLPQTGRAQIAATVSSDAKSKAFSSSPRSHHFWSEGKIAEWSGKQWIKNMQHACGRHWWDNEQD